MPRLATVVAARQLLFTTDFMGEFCGDNTGGHGDDGIADQHGHGGDGLTQCRMGGDIPKAHGGDGDDGPVNAFGDAGKTVLGPLHHKHDAAEDHAQHQHTGVENEDPPPRLPQ